MASLIWFYRLVKEMFFGTIEQPMFISRCGQPTTVSSLYGQNGCPGRCSQHVPGQPQGIGWGEIRYALSFTLGDARPPADEHPYTARTIAEFIGWHCAERRAGEGCCRSSCELGNGTRQARGGPPRLEEQGAAASRSAHPHMQRSIVTWVGVPGDTLLEGGGSSVCASPLRSKQG